MLRNATARRVRGGDVVAPSWVPNLDLCGRKTRPSPVPQRNQDTRGAHVGMPLGGAPGTHRVVPTGHPWWWLYALRPPRLPFDETGAQSAAATAPAL